MYVCVFFLLLLFFVLYFSGKGEGESGVVMEKSTPIAVLYKVGTVHTQHGWRLHESEDYEIERARMTARRRKDIQRGLLE